MDEQLATVPPYKPTVLLVDDEESILNSLRRLLRGQPYEVLLAASAAQALEIMATQPVDLIMSDARMPVMVGKPPAEASSHLEQSRVEWRLSGKTDSSRRRLSVRSSVTRHQ